MIFSRLNEALSKYEIYNNKSNYRCDYVLKEEQRMAIEYILSGKDTHCILPIGFGWLVGLVLTALYLPERERIEKRQTREKNSNQPHPHLLQAQ